MKEKIKTISIIVLAITVVVLSIVCINLNTKYDTNTHSLNTKADCFLTKAHGNSCVPFNIDFLNIFSSLTNTIRANNFLIQGVEKICQKEQSKSPRA